MITQILSKVLWLYAGALIPTYMAKLNIIQLDGQTNVVMPTLIGMLLAACTLFLFVLGY